MGQKQHGHMEAVGYDLYCKMLNEAVKNLKGIATIEDFATTIDLDVDAYIPPSYIVNEAQKLDIYKRIAGIENRTESEDMKEELLDRFGEIPKSVDNLLRIALIRVQAHKLYMSEIKGRSEEIKFTFHPEAKIKIEQIPALVEQYNRKLSFSPKGVPCFLYRYKKYGVVEKDAEKLLELTEELLNNMSNILS